MTLCQIYSKLSIINKSIPGLATHSSLWCSCHGHVLWLTLLVLLAVVGYVCYSGDDFATDFLSLLMFSPIPKFVNKFTSQIFFFTPGFIQLCSIGLDSIRYNHTYFPLKPNIGTNPVNYITSHIALPTEINIYIAYMSHRYTWMSIGIDTLQTYVGHTLFWTCNIRNGWYRTIKCIISIRIQPFSLFIRYLYSWDTCISTEDRVSKITRKDKG